MPVGSPRIGQADLGPVGLDGLGLTGQGSEHVEADHVARALPHPVDRALAEQPGQARLLDEPVAAQAFERLGRMLRGPLAGPVLHDGGQQALEEALLLVARCGAS